MSHPDGLAWAALIEWIDEPVAEPRHLEAQRKSPEFIESFTIDKP